jgi:hypothetical protein
MKSFLVKLGVVLIIGIVTFGCAGMRRASWKSFSSTDLYEGFYYVTKSHLLYKGTVQVSVKLEYTKKGIAEHVKEFGKDYENLSYSLQSWEVDCRAKKERILSNNRYSVEGNLINTKLAKGRLSGSQGRLSGSLGKSLYEAVCK